MKIISTNYTGVIPGIGKGPFTNLKISDTLYANLQKLGYPVTITSVAAKPKVKVENVSAPSAPKKPVTKAEEAVREAEVAATVKPTVTEEPKVEETSAPAPETTEVAVETPAPEAEEPKAEEAVTEEAKASYTKEELEAMEQSQLEEILGPEPKRPLRYGKPWLIKQILAK